MAKKLQIEKARELGVDEDEAKFDEALRRLANKPSNQKALDDLAEIRGQTDPNKNLGRKKRD